MYTDLVFDLYGTLVDIHTDDSDLVWEKTALFFGFHGASRSGPSLHASFNAMLAAREASAGQSYECYPDIPFDEVMAELFAQAGVTKNASALGVQAAELFRIASLDYIRLYPHVLDSLATLRKQGYRLWLLSNAQHAFTAPELRLMNLTDCFDGVLLSSDYGCRKPDVRFYQALLNKYNLSPEHCLMIGNDRQTDIAGAISAGMATLYMHTNLTPSDQASANPALHPACAIPGQRHFEVEGADWKALAELISGL